MILCGLDECGRGPLAGPLVAAAVILPIPIKGLNDSKKLSALQRQKLYRQIKQSGAVIAIEEISVRQINSKGIGWANKEIFKRLILKIDAEKYIVDGNLKIKVRGKSKMIKSEIKADGKFPEVMAASIIAKVWRDRLMDNLHTIDPEYGWQTNKGYGTKYHISALHSYGSTKHHRNLFVNTALKTKI